MTDAQRAEESRPELDKGKVGEINASVVQGEPPSASGTKVSAPGEPATTKQPTAEEQMALYEKELKENDWGHQPC